MTAFLSLTERNLKLFFRDKGMFFTALITPAVLLGLYVAFLGDVYHEIFLSSLPEGLELPQKLLDGLVGGQLVSSILSVSCVTVAFCANFLMVQDRVTGSIRDLRLSPVSPHVVSAAYFLAAYLTTLIICTAAMAVCLIYLAIVGWYLTAADILLMFADILLLSLFGTVLSSIINFFLRSQGQISAVGTIISAGYGFLCGAYMPISSLSEGLRNVISCLPGTYGNSLLRNHAMRSAFDALAAEGVPQPLVEGLMEGMDCTLSFFGHAVSIPVMYAVLCAAIALLIGVYVLLVALLQKKK